MAKTKQQPRYNVLCIRVSDDDKQILEALSRGSQKTISALMREALAEYLPCCEKGAPRL